MNGCLKWFAIGCGTLFAIGLACGIFGAFFVRQAIPPMEELPQVTAEGDCPTDDVRAFLDSQDERLEAALEAVEAFGEGDEQGGGLRAAIDQIDLETLIDGRDALLKTEAPACAVGLLAAEADLLDSIVESVENMRACGVDSSFCLTRQMIGAVTRISRHGGRINEARFEIAEAAGIDPEEMMDDGGLDIRIGPGSGG